MTRPRYDADDPREWLARARSALAHAQQGGSGVLFEDLCYSAQQAAEKAIKAVFVRRGQAFPYSHNLDRLLELLRRAGVPIPDEVAKAGTLTPYALEVRYPGLSRETTEEDYHEALSTAESVVRWAETLVVAPTE